jgi:hypothetical protein
VSLRENGVQLLSRKGPQIAFSSACESDALVSVIESVGDHLTELALWDNRLKLLRDTVLGRADDSSLVVRRFNKPDRCNHAFAFARWTTNWRNDYLHSTVSGIL